MRFNIKALFDDEGSKEYEKVLLEERKLSHYRKSGVGERYMELGMGDWTSETEEQAAAFSVVSEFISDINKGVKRDLWLCGSVGTGKTMLASLICRETMGTYRLSRDLMNDLRAAASFKSPESVRDILGRLGSCRLLVIDEVGKSRGWQAEELDALWQVTNARYNGNRPTVLVSNLFKRELASYLGEHITDRFIEAGKSFEFRGESYRHNLRVF